LIAEEVQAGELYAFRHQDSIWNRTFDLVYHKDKHLSPAMSDFMEVARNYDNTGSVTTIPSGQLS
jgi:DNA-binding transcriptional LysR family regulator